MWQYGGDSISKKTLLDEINALASQGINKTLMKRMLIIVFCLCISLGLVGCGTSAPDPAAIQICNLATYKKSAQPLMQEFSGIVNQLQIRDATSRTATKSRLESLLSKINQVKCRDDFPLKQETLEYSVRHMIDAIEYADKGNFVEMNYSINKSLLNVETFQDWSVDVD